MRLIVDGSKVGLKHRLLMVGLAYRKRAIPIAWSWVPSEKGHSSYVLHQKSSHLVCVGRCSEPHRPRREWRVLGELIKRRGERVWLEGALLSRLHAHKTNLVLYWKKGEKEP